MPRTHPHSELLGTALGRSGRTVAVAESLTSGALAAELGRAPDAASWFVGGVVAYVPRITFDLLNVPPGRVVSATAATAMANAVAHLFAADLSVAVTGVGGPGPDGDVPAGTVWFAVRADGATRSSLCRFAGEPHDVLDQSVTEAVRLLILAARGVGASRARGTGGTSPETEAARADATRGLGAPVAGDLPVTPTWSS